VTPIEREIEFWEEAARAAETRDLTLTFLGMVFGLKCAMHSNWHFAGAEELEAKLER
jgi:hypothetical protein